MLLKNVLEKLDIVTANADMNIEIHGIGYDTRTLRAGELFAAVRGFETDGHQYIDEAVRKGAVCVVCEQPPSADVPYVIVSDSRKALAVMSANWFGDPAEKLKMIGVTGTNGKTTVTNLIKEILEKCTGEKVGLIGTNGNMIGSKRLDAVHTTPESYELQQLLSQMADEGCKFAVMEVSSHALYLDRVYGIQFEAGVFTNLSPDHLDFHGTMEEYAKVKAGLFKNCRCGIINIDNKYADTMLEAADCRILTFAVNNDAADLMAKSIKLHADRIEFCALTIGRIRRIELNIPGMFSVYNALAALLTAETLGIDVDNVAAVLKTCGSVKGRAEIVPTNRDFTVLIDYAHTPDALENIITAARDFTSGRLITLFGCGGDRDRTKRPVMGEIAARLSDFVVVTSDNPRTENPGVIIDEIVAGMNSIKTSRKVIENRREAIAWSLENAKPGDVIILAGKGHETYQIFGKEKRHFDEREVVAELLANMQ